MRTAKRCAVKSGAALAFTWAGVAAVVALLLTAAGCQRPNPAYHPLALDDAGIDAASGSGGAATGSGGATGTGGTPIGTGGSTTDTGGAGGRAGAGAGGQAADAGMGGSAVDGGRVDGGTGGGPVQCRVADCLASHGAAPCGMWECRLGTCAVACPNCTDTDGDGFGTGTGCAGADCDDNDPQVNRTGARACYTGPAVTKGVGVCRAGAEVCVGGTWSGCNGQVLPGGEACNGEDDDCNGTVDDQLGAISCGIGACAKQVAACTSGKLGLCTATASTAASDACDGIDNDCDGAVDEDCATCVRVSPSGDDDAANGAELPFRTLQAAINWAAMPDHPKRVCVAGGATCLDRATYTSPSSMPALTMANGVSLYGNYEDTTWTRCPLTLVQLVATGPTVTIENQTPVGVVFPAAVTTPTVLDGFAFLRVKGDALPSTSAITVDGAKQVTLANLTVADAPNAVASWGVNLVNGAQALITRSLIVAGGGTSEAIAVRSVGSQPVIRDNCSTLDPSSGRCSATSCTSGLGLRGRTGNSGPSTDAATSAGVMLRDSPGALVERNTVCGGPARAQSGVRIAGGAAGTVVRGNVIIASGGVDESHGVWLDACADATPWIVDNEVIAAEGAAGATVFGIRSLGACHPVIDSNARIQGGGEASTGRAGGVLCGTASSAVSRCLVANNKLVQGASTQHPALSVGVACEGGACARIVGNVISGGAGGDVAGVIVTNGGAPIERNAITGGCGTKTTAGILAENTSGRIENNLVRAGVCSGNSTIAGSVWGLHIHVAGGGSELEVHSNTVDAGGSGPCAGAAVVFGTASAGAAVAPRKGVFRNNIFRAGACTGAHYGFWEDAPPSEPRVFESNDLDPTGSPTGLYLDNNATPLTTAAAVNALTGTAAAANLGADPMFVSYPTDLHLGAASACINAGTPVGAPARDYAGKTRDAKPDIGAYEQ